LICYDLPCLRREPLTFNQTTAGETRYPSARGFTASPKPGDSILEGIISFGTFLKGEATPRDVSMPTIGRIYARTAIFKDPGVIGSDISSGGRQTQPGNAFDELFRPHNDQLEY